jgi:AcrR family transcriptional regulator
MRVEHERAAVSAATTDLVPDLAPPRPEGSPATGAPRRSRKRESTRQRVLDAAREVFAERGVIGGTVEDICERAGFTRGAFYSNFTDKDEVLEALIEREHTRLLEHLDASFALVDRELAEAPDLESALGPIVERILRSVPMDRQLSLVQTEMEIHAIRVPERSAAFRAAEARFRDRIATFIEEAMTRYGRELLLEPDVVADAAVGVMERSVRRASLAGGGADPDAVARAVLPRLLLSVSRPAGRQ